MKDLELEGKEVKLWTKNRFFYHGRIELQNKEYLCLYDFKKNEQFMISLDSVSHINIVSS